MTRILLLGGTEEARRLAAELVAAGLPLLVSLAGRTRGAAPYLAETRIGGFGGEAALAAFLAAERIGLVADATHPFAAAISPAAARAAAAVGIPYLRLQRPPWPVAPGDVEVPDLGAAAAALPAGACVFLTVGSASLGPFLERRDVRYVLRTVEAPDLAGRTDIEVIRARGPFGESDEQTLFDAHPFDRLVTKNAGGSATAAKLAIARARAIPVILIARPPGQPPADADDVPAMLAAVRARL